MNPPLILNHTTREYIDPSKLDRAATLADLATSLPITVALITLIRRNWKGHRLSISGDAADYDETGDAENALTALGEFTPYTSPFTHEITYLPNGHPNPIGEHLIALNDDDRTYILLTHETVEDLIHHLATDWSGERITISEAYRAARHFSYLNLTPVTA